MNKISVIVLTFFLFGCSSSELRVVPSYEMSDLSGLCSTPGENISISAAFVKKDDQIAFFGGSPPAGILPLLICISNGTDWTFGLNQNTFSVHVNANKSMSPLAETKVDSENGAMSSTIAFLGGTAAIGLIPGILIASSVEMQASADSTEIAINMKNMRLLSGIVPPMGVKAGFLYIDKSSLPEEVALDALNLIGELLDLKNKAQFAMKSKIATFE